MESSYNNYVYYIDYKGQEYATISWCSIKYCHTASNGELCSSSGYASLSMRSSQKDFIVTPHIQNKMDYYSSYSSGPWQPYFSGTYDVIYSPKNKIVKKGNFSVSTTASEGDIASYKYGSQEILVSQ